MHLSVTNNRCLILKFEFDLPYKHGMLGPTWASHLKVNVIEALFRYSFLVVFSELEKHFRIENICYVNFCCQLHNSPYGLRFPMGLTGV